MEEQMTPLLIPAGMLRISRDGEADRVIYPVHAEGWRQLGWTIHPPPQDPDDGDPDEGDSEGLEEELGEPVLGTLSGGAAQELTSAAAALAEEPAAAQDQAISQLQASFEGMTKAQIIAAVDGRFGVQLDPGMTRSQLITAALDLDARAAAAEAAAPDQANADTDAGADASAVTGDLADDGIEALIPTLL